MMDQFAYAYWITLGQGQVRALQGPRFSRIIPPEDPDRSFRSVWNAHRALVHRDEMMDFIPRLRWGTDLVPRQCFHVHSPFGRFLVLQWLGDRDDHGTTVVVSDNVVQAIYDAWVDARQKRQTRRYYQTLATIGQMLFSVGFSMQRPIDDAFQRRFVAIRTREDEPAPYNLYPCN